MNLATSKPVRALILTMLAVVIIGVIIARSYYAKLDNARDPRILQARELYAHYDQVAGAGDFHALFDLLDSIEEIYNATEHYRASFETGVLENNRAAAYLTLALYGDSIEYERNPFPHLQADSLVSIASDHALKAIAIYKTWGKKYSGLNEDEIADRIRPEFQAGLPLKEPDQVEKYIKNRAREIIEAMDENDRRLSVCHTNLGVIYRQQGAYLEAVQEYEQAIQLWDRNLEAENNLNKILNKPLKKRNLIQKLFPPERKE